MLKINLNFLKKIKFKLSYTFQKIFIRKKKNFEHFFHLKIENKII